MAFKNFRYWVLLALLPLLTACGGGGSDCKTALGAFADCSDAKQTQPVDVNVAPKAVTAESVSGIVNTKVELDGSNSLDDNRDALSYAWTLFKKPSNSNAVLNGANTPKPNFVADVTGTYTLLFSVNDGKLSSPFVNVTVTVVDANAAPKASAGPDRGVVIGNTLILDGSSSSDANGDALTYVWEIIDKPEESTKALLLPNDGVKAYFVPDIAGIYRVSLVVSDGVLKSDLVLVTITASNNNLPPIADAGSDLEGTVGMAVNLDGSASSDPNGDTLTYAWATVYAPSGSTKNLLDAGAPKTVFMPDLPGLYVFSLVVSDRSMSSTPAFVTVTVN